MIDIRLLRDKPDEVRAAYERLGATVDLAGVTAADARVRDLKNESQTMQAEQNRLSKEIGRAAAGEARERAKADWKRSPGSSASARSRICGAGSGRKRMRSRSSRRRPPAAWWSTSRSLSPG